MTILGILLALIGGAGALGIFLGIIRSDPPVGDIRIWGAVAVVGVVLAILTRRPRD